MPIKPEYRINIEPGDVIGIFFPKYNPVPWSPETCTGENAHVFRRNPKNLAVGVEYKFSEAPNDWNPCRRYSINATVMDREGTHTITRAITHIQYMYTHTHTHTHTQMKKKKFLLDTERKYNYV